MTMGVGGQAGKKCKCMNVFPGYLQVEKKVVFF